MKASIQTSVLVILALALPAGLLAQEPMPQPQPEMDSEVAALMNELQEIQQRLGPIQQEAMQDPTLSAQLQEVQTEVEAAMQEEDPALFQRLEGIQTEMQAAQEAGDQERLQAIAVEAQGMQQDLQTLQETALARPEIQQRVDAFETAQRARMMEIDPEAGALIDRVREIHEELIRQQEAGHPQH